MPWVRAICGLVALGAMPNVAGANPINLSNGLAATDGGHLDIDLDEFGGYGWLIGMQGDDQFTPATGETRDPASYTSGAYAFIRTPDTNLSNVVLTASSLWIRELEGGGMADGIIGQHANLTREIITANMLVAPNEIASTFALHQPAGPIRLTFALRQILTFDSATGTTQLAQAYVIKNEGTVAIELGFVAQWNPYLSWGPNATDFDDVVGVGPGLCSIYAREPQSSDVAVVMKDAGSSVPVRYYYAGKAYVTPEQGPPQYTPRFSNDVDAVFAQGGLPPSWRNHLATVGYNMPGESSTQFPGESNPSLGLEYQVSLAVGASATIRVHRIYRTFVTTCIPSAGVNCGNAVTDTGEQCDGGGVDTDLCNANCTMATCGDGYTNMAVEACDSTGVDTPACNGGTCVAPTCGDGYRNLAAGEACDDGVDTAACNARDCQPPRCGDGYVNSAAGEQCEDVSGYCDPTTCELTYTVGGGCGGCGSGGSSSPLLLILFLLLGRRRR